MASMMMSSSTLKLLPRLVVSQTARSFHIGQVNAVQRSQPVFKVETMKQVEVDELDVQKRLGNLSMNFVRKAEKKNKERAKNHRLYRRTDWMIAGTCFGIVVGIYSYTIFAIKQENFLDDFEMPEEIDRIPEEDK